MRALILGTALALLAAAPAALAQTTPAPAAAPAPAASAPKHYTTTETPIGTLLDDPASKAVIDKHLPELATNPQIDMARPMSLKAVQPYAADKITDEVLAKIDADLATLPVK
jgi:hypothetical protein